jgi:hypothetical protein
MERLAMPPTERDDFIAKLVHAHGRTAANKENAAETVEKQPDTAATKSEAVNQDVAIKNVTIEPAPDKKAARAKARPASDINDAYTEKARQLATGDWMEFLGSDGKAKRAKLSWVSPITNSYLFTDRQGLKAGNFSLEELADLLRCARANILNAAPLMDRAVSTVLKEYQKN